MNAFAFIMLQKKIADSLGIPVGTYTHRANSYHCYKRDFAIMEQYNKGIRDEWIEDITYDYENYYKELMEESIPEILETIKNISRSK